MDFLLRQALIRHLDLPQSPNFATEKPHRCVNSMHTEMPTSPIYVGVAHAQNLSGSSRRKMFHEVISKQYI